MQSSQTMPSLNRIISIIVNGESNFCCLCFNVDGNIGLHDEINIEIETGQNIAVADMLQFVLGNEIEEYTSAFDNICEDCLKSIVNIYTFIQTRQYNAMLLTNALNSLNNSCEYIKDENGNSKSLFVTLNIKDFTSEQFYDSKKLDSTNAALKRFKVLSTPKTKVFVKRDESSQKMSKNKHKIKTSEMLLDPNDKFVRKCKVCLKAYPSMSKLKHHFLRSHAPKNYKCPTCATAYGSPNLLTYHINKCHSEVICGICGKTFQNRNTLTRHEIAHHMNIVCSNCGRTYKSRLTFKKHIDYNVCEQERRASPADAQFTCDYCGKRYTQKMSLRVHIQYEHGNYNGHICEWCGKKFWAQSRLKAHIVKHTREKNFTCSICQGKFVTKESLLYHTRLHTGEKPYKCSKCRSTFISASRRAYHMKTYHFSAVAECEICHSKFTSALYLDKHKKCHKHLKDGENTNGKEEVNLTNSETSVKKEDKKINEKFMTKMIVEDNEMPKTNVHISMEINDQSISDASVVFID